MVKDDWIKIEHLARELLREIKNCGFEQKDNQGTIQLKSIIMAKLASAYHNYDEKKEAVNV